MRTVLIVDDSLTWRKFLQDLLERAGYCVLIAEDGRTVTGLLETVAVDLVVTDLFMPNKDGIETLMAVRRHSNAVPVLMLTDGMRGCDALLTRMLRLLGAEAVVNKSISSPDLLGLVARLASRCGATPHIPAGPPQVAHG